MRMQRGIQEGLLRSASDRSLSRGSSRLNRGSNLNRHQLRVAAGILHNLDGVFGRESAHSQRELFVGCGLNGTAVDAQNVLRSSGAAAVHFYQELGIFHGFLFFVQNDWTDNNHRLTEPKSSTRARGTLCIKGFKLGWLDSGTRNSRRDISHSYNLRLVSSPCQLRTVLSNGQRSGLQNLTGLRMHLLIFDFIGVPAATERFYQVNRANHSLPEQLRFQPLTRE